MSVKSTLVIACLCALLSSCDLRKASVDMTLHFTAGSVDGTRSLIQDHGGFQEGNSFGVYGAYSPASDFSKPTVEFDNTEVTYDGFVWDYLQKKYWYPGNRYRFRAFFPYTEPGSPGSYRVEYPFGTEDHFLIRDFTVPRQPEQQSDLMVSRLVERPEVEAGRQPQPVAFSFQHLLTQVNVRIRRNIYNQQYQDFTLTSVKLVGMKTKGSYDSRTETWTVSASAEDPLGQMKSFTGTDGLIQEFSGLPVWNEGLMMIPQSFKPGELRLEVDYTAVDKDGQKVKDHKSATVPVTEGWTAAHRIVYVATIDYKHDIHFSIVEVEPWTFSENSNNVVIK